MLNYYRYLWKISWPEVIMTSIISVFLLVRLIEKVRHDLKQYKKWGRLFIILRVGFWSVILGAYLLMFSLDNPDWFEHPKEIQGELQGKSLSNSQDNPYSLQVQEGTQTLSLWVDYRTYKTVNLGDQVKIKVLPNCLEVYQCEVLP
ncbi:hypothetical protein [Desulfitobacterium metallireducens]|uniref:Uncharacterized protein n=1 Tax=Desulfitobacterium metallireducens DSM 15288 TaxID=871968 RepID=W0EGL8_9FIRM|nr:hypothetical protein [Desulfitobacterium metallireducens]AHF08653.1 hypothetical protein DESME_12550 [Desulfitobacterium metallireducens DSM 15288]